MAAATSAAQIAPLSKGDMISRILDTAKQAAIVSNRHGEFQANAANYFINLAFMSEEELLSICKKIRVIA